MKPGKLEITVDASVSVSQESAARCLRILEWFVNDHNELRVMGETDSSGCQHFWFERRDGEQK